MRNLHSGALSPRASTRASLCLLLLLGLGIAYECQQLSRANERIGHRSSPTTRALPDPFSSTRSESPGKEPVRLAVPRPSPATPPLWKSGFQWHYRWSDSRGSGTYIRAVVGEENVDGVPSYVMRTGDRNIFWGKTDLAWLMESVRGEIESRAVPAYRKFLWPLAPGKTWESRYAWEDPRALNTIDRVRRHRVAALERVEVPAGAYRALRVVVTDSAGRKLNEYWYAPEIRWLVKERLFLPQGVRDRELIYASLWPELAAR